MALQIKVAALVIPVILVFCITALVSAFVFHDHHHRKLFVGSIGLGASVTMYGSPLVAVVSHLFPLQFRHTILQCNLYRQTWKRSITCKSIYHLDFVHPLNPLGLLMHSLLIIAETSDTHKECGIHAVPLIVLLIPS